MRRVLDGYEGERVLIGEAYLPIDRLVTYYGGAGDGFHLPFNFHLISTPWTPTAIASLILAYEAKLPAGAGQIGSWAIMTGRALPAGSVAPRPRSGHAAPHLARNSDALSRRRVGHEGCRDTAASRSRSMGTQRSRPGLRPGSSANSDAMVRRSPRRLQHGGALVTAQRRLA